MVIAEGNLSFPQCIVNTVIVNNLMDSWFLIVSSSSLGDRVSLHSFGCAGT